jgi:hypothetical protein
LKVGGPLFASAHAGYAPWEGVNALDAAFVAYAGISALRQQIRPEQRVHGVISGRDWTPNGSFPFNFLIIIVRLLPLTSGIKTKSFYLFNIFFSIKKKRGRRGRRRKKYK